jgi:hypothetical protein
VICDALLSLLFSLLNGFLDLLAHLVPPPPSFIVSGLNYLPEIYGWASAFDSWIPVNFALGAVAWMVGVQFATMGLKLLRMFISYATFGGGAT